MQDRDRLHSVSAGVSVLAAGTLLVMACSSDPPSAAVVPRNAQSPDAALVDDTDAHLQEAATQYYGKLAPGEAKHRGLLWFVFDHDWTVRKHDVGTAEVVESNEPWKGTGHPWSVNITPGETARESETGISSRRAWSVNESLAKKYPEFEGLGTGRVGANVVSNFGGGRVLLGTDSVMVFWARYAQ